MHVRILAINKQRELPIIVYYIASHYCMPLTVHVAVVHMLTVGDSGLPPRHNHYAGSDATGTDSLRHRGHW